jgi:hypothetical protein
MSGPIITGVKGAYQQPQRLGFAESGEYAILTWEGTRNEVLANIPGITAMGGFWDFEDSFSGAKCKLTGRFAALPGQQEIPIDTWEFFAGEAEKDILEADNAAVNGISDDEKRKIRDAIQNPVPGQSPSLVNANAINLYLLMLSGVRSVRVVTPTLRHTQTVSNNWTIPASRANVGRIISTASMVSLEAIPSDILFGLPNFVSTRTGLTYGWLKLDPTIRSAARQKTQIEQEWRYGLWATTPPLYQAVL